MQVFDILVTNIKSLERVSIDEFREEKIVTGGSNNGLSDKYQIERRMINEILVNVGGNF